MASNTWSPVIDAKRPPAWIGGAQAQVEPCAFHALALRTQGFPDATRIRELVLSEHQLVRTWGQRDTLHMYAREHWRTYVAARTFWPPRGRRGGMPSAELVQWFAQHFEAAGQPLVRSDLFDLIPNDFVAAVSDHPGAGSDPRRFAASRIVWQLASKGEVVFAGKQGSQQAYVHRSVWHDTDTHFDSDLDAALAVLKTYLAAFGPATAADAAHHFGCRVTDTRTWLKLLGDEVAPIRTNDRDDLWMLAKDVDALEAPQAWPTRLLPGYDTVLMGHKDKRWLVDHAEEPLVWRKSAVVAPTVLHRGLIVATWNHTVVGKELQIQVEPLSGWDRTMLPDATLDAQNLAQHLGAKDVRVDVSP
ncbi:MAG: winged helix DNA-binding domain-containing protein [bacterium]